MVLEAMSKNWRSKGEATQGNMDLDGQLMQEQLHSTPMVVDDSRWFSVGCISNDFDANEFEREEEEQEEDRIGDVVSSDSDDSDDDQGGRHAMPVPVHDMPLPVPTEVLHAMPAQKRLVIDLPEDDTLL